MSPHTPTPDAPGGVEERIQELNRRAWSLRYDDIQQALALSKAAHELAGPPEQPRSLPGLADSLRTLSYCHERLGEYDTAIGQADAAHACYTALGDRAGQAAALLLLAGCYWGVGDYSHALARARESIEVAEQCGQLLTQAKALNVIGLIYQSTNHPDEALRYFEASLQLSRRTGKRHEQADTLYNIGEIHLQLGAYDEALAATLESLEIQRAIGYHYDLGMILALLGRIRAAQGAYEEARRHLEEGLASADASRHGYSRLLCLIELGRLARQQGDQSAARDLLLDALALSSSAGAKEERSQCHELLADIYFQMGEPALALEHYRQFHELTDQLRENVMMHQLKNLELVHQMEAAQREREFYRLKHIELAREVEERRRVEAELRQRIGEISTLNQVTQLVVQHTDLATLLDQVTSELIALFDVRGVAVVLFDHQQSALTCVAAADRSPEAASVAGMMLPIATVPAAAQLIAAHEPLVVAPDEAADQLGPLAERFREAQIHSALLLPLLVRSEVTGALMLTTDRGAPALTTLNVRLLETIAGQIAAAIEHARLFEAAQRAREAAEAASRVKSRFLATMSHEIRTPLNGVLGYAQLLQLDPALQPRQREHLEKIERSGQHLLQLLSDILDLARIEAGRLELDEQVVDLAALLQESVDVFAVAAQQKGLTLELVVGDTPAFELPSLVRVDARRLRQVLINLLGNAVKFTDAGGVTCVVADAPGERPPPGRRRLRFALRDSGIGIDAAEIPQLMTPFHQIGDLTSRNPGAGLGLAICAELLRKMGSELRVRSEPGEGSEFWFDLELTVADHPDAPQQGGGGQ